MSFQHLPHIIHAAPPIRHVELGLFVPGCAGEERRVHPSFLDEPGAKIDRLLSVVAVDESLLGVVWCEGSEQKGECRRVCSHGARIVFDGHG